VTHPRVQATPFQRRGTTGNRSNSTNSVPLFRKRIKVPRQ
jgi:hypothetical protein